MEPRTAGLEGEFAVVSWFRIAACPLPLRFVVKMPGAANDTGNLIGPSVLLPAWTVTNVGKPGRTSKGTTALIWQLDAYKTVAGYWLNSTNGLMDPKPLPSRVTISPGATAPVGKAEA